MLGNVDKNLKLLTILLLLTFSGVTAKAKCMKKTKEQYIQRTPIFVKGKIQNLKIGSPHGNKAPKVSFDITVLMVFKGDVSQKTLKVEYENVRSKPGLRSFTEGQVFIFGISKIDRGKAKFYPSICSPVLNDEDFSKKNSSAIIKDESLAIVIAEAYLKSIYGDRVLKQRPFKAEKSGSLWSIKGTFHCPTGKRCFGGVAEIEIEENGRVVHYIHGK